MTDAIIIWDKTSICDALQQNGEQVTFWVKWVFGVIVRRLFYMEVIENIFWKVTTYYWSQTTFEIKCSTLIGGAYKNFQSKGLLKQKLLLSVSRLTLTYDHWANRSSGRYPDLLPKPHKNARIYTFCAVESRPGVCFRIRLYSKESQRKCSIQKESVIITYYWSQTTFEIKCSTPIGGAYKNEKNETQSSSFCFRRPLLWKFL